MRTYRIFILGAGFSRAAGLPLGRELFYEVRKVIADQYSSDNPLERDLARFVQYSNAFTGGSLSSNEVDFEEFLGFLDTEHFLGLKGKDTWSSAGNESQLMIRHSIGRILVERMPKTLPEVYYRFARGLNTTDTILTFNYDILVERALNETGIPFRLFPERFTEIYFGSATVDNSRDELVLLKLHGSIDWVDKSHYEERCAQVKAYPHAYPPAYEPNDPVFGAGRLGEPLPLVEGPRDPTDGLQRLYRVQNLERLYQESPWKFSPFILSPSHAKVLYGQPLLTFWWGLNRWGGLNLGLNIIGYSLPSHDDHARHVIYQLSKNYLDHEPELEFNGYKKRPIRLLTLSQSTEEETTFQESFRFLDWKQVEVWNRGITTDSVEWVLR